jgi:hypothetical protein
MTAPTISPPIPSEFDDEADDAELPSGKAWAYSCKLRSCPDYGKSWLLRSNFLLHLKEQNAHTETASTPADRRRIEIASRHITDPYLPPRAAPGFLPREEPGQQVWQYSFRNDAGQMISRTGTQEQMEADLLATQRQQAEGL